MHDRPAGGRQEVDPQRLRQLCEQGRTEEAVELLAGIGLDTERDPEILYWAGRVLHEAGDDLHALDLVKRAVAAGFRGSEAARCLSRIELRRGNVVDAVFYLTVCALLDAAHDGVLGQLKRLIPDFDPDLVRGGSVAQSAIATARAKERLGRTAAAVCYYTAAFAGDPLDAGLRADLLRLAPAVLLEVLPSVGGQTSLGPLPSDGDAGAADTGDVTPQLLRRFCAQGAFAEGAARLAAIDLDADHSPDLLYHAALCVAGAGATGRAIELMKRAVATGASQFYAAYHLAYWEMDAGNPAAAAFYFTACTILDPAREDVSASLRQLVPSIGEGTPAISAESARAAGLKEGSAEQRMAAVHHFTTALGLDSRDEGARSGLLRLVPDVTLAVLFGNDAEMDRPGSGLRQAVDIEGLVYGSVLERLRSSSPGRIHTVECGARGLPVEVAVVDEVAYFPWLFLQVWRGRIVPQEANPDVHGLTHLRLSIQAGTAGRLGTRLMRPLPEIAEDVCILGNFNSYGFYHFFEELYKVVILERFGFRGKYVLSNARADYFPSFPVEFLELLGIDRKRIMHLSHAALFRSVYYVTPLTSQNVQSYSDVFFALRQALITAAATEQPGLGPRLWIERLSSRVVINPEEVAARLDRHGFVRVDFAALPVARQIAAAKRAEVLAGPHGAGLLHSMFLPEGSTVIECFSPLYVNPSIFDICRNLRHRYFQLVPLNVPLAPYPHGMDVEVDCEHLEITLQGLGR